MILLFFFQAEDGIRDLTVTGVQTCALPISWSRHSRGFPEAADFRSTSQRPCRGSQSTLALHGTPVLAQRQVNVTSGRPPVKRSEERRVGKECRSRWSPYH